MRSRAFRRPGFIGSTDRIRERDPRSPSLEIDPSKYLPSDDSTRGFDNIAGALAISPALLEGYTSAAEKISRLAVGDVTEATQTTYRVPSDTSQDYHVEGLPFATRGGLVASTSSLPTATMSSKSYPINQGLMDNNRSFGEIRGEKLELLIDGERVHLYDWDKDVGTGAPVHQGTADVHVHGESRPAYGRRHFPRNPTCPGSDLNEHFMRSTIETGGLPGFKFWPHVGKIDILGPNKPERRRRVREPRKDFHLQAGDTAQEDRLRESRS